MLRTAGCVLEDLRLTQADLEDVFVGVMQGEGLGGVGVNVVERAVP
jgi:hypothetical protein